MTESKKVFQLNTEWIVTIGFILFIAVISIMTLILRFVPKEQTSGQEAASVLDGNGTTVGLESDANTDNIAQKVEKPVEISDETFLCFKESMWFAKLKSTLEDYTDHLFLRKEMIAINTDFSSLITGNTYLESTQVLKGRDGYLFFKSTIDGNPIGDYMGTNYFSEEELQAMAANMTLFRDTIKAQYGADVVFMGVSNKENIYSEYMPDTIPKINEKTRLDQVTEYMQTQTDLCFLNPKEYLLMEKENYQVYYKTDTHWNQIGAYIGVQSFLTGYYGNDYIGPDGMVFLEAPDKYAGDLATIAGVEDDYRTDTVYVMEPTSRHYSQCHEEDVVLMVGDSFSGFLSSTAEPFFKKVVRVDRTQFSMSIVEELRPDVIVWESVERYIEYYKDKNLLEY